MADLETLAEYTIDQAALWESHGTAESNRHAADWDALHTLTLAAGSWVEHIHRSPVWPSKAVLRAEEDTVAAVRRMAAHLREVPDG